jgi:hypothetical protein
MRQAFTDMRARFPLESFLQRVEGGTQCGMLGGKRPLDWLVQRASIGRLTFHGDASSVGRAPKGVGPNSI